MSLCNTWNKVNSNDNDFVFVSSFYLFSPLSYGAEGDLAHTEGGPLHRLKWLDSWDI